MNSINIYKYLTYSLLIIGLLTSNNAKAQSQSWLSQTIPQSLNQPLKLLNQQKNNSARDLLSSNEIFALSPNQNRQLQFSEPANISGVPATENALIKWVISNQDNHHRHFLIANKRLGEMILVDESGVIVARSPALYGINFGDSLTTKQTPAGVFHLQRVSAKHPGYGGDVLTFVNDDIRKVSVSIHRVWMENPSERRIQRLSSPNPNQRRISDGCINLPDSFYESIVNLVDGSKIYILPETRNYF